MSILNENIDPNVKLGDYYNVTLFWQVFSLHAQEQVDTIMLPCDLVQLHHSGPPHKELRTISYVEPETQKHDQQLTSIMELSADTDIDDIEEALIAEVQVIFRTSMVNVIKCNPKAYHGDPCYMVQIANPIDNYGYPMILIGTPYIMFYRKQA